MKFLNEIKSYKKQLLKNNKSRLKELICKVNSTERIPGIFLESLRKPEISLIAEIKMASPSKGKLSLHSVEKLAEIYNNAPVDAVSVLTEDKYFKGSIENIVKVKSLCQKPVLMKDFIISEYQIYEGVAYGANAVLLIAALLSVNKLEKLLNLCRILSISALVEVHSKKELKKCLDLDGIEIIGVNSRNLKTLEINEEIQNEIVSLIPDGIVKIAESGINSKERVKDLYGRSYDAVLVGEGIVNSNNPADKINEIKSAV